MSVYKWTLSAVRNYAKVKLNGKHVFAIPQLIYDNVYIRLPDKYPIVNNIHFTTEHCNADDTMLYAINFTTKACSKLQKTKYVHFTRVQILDVPTPSHPNNGNLKQYSIIST